MSKWNWKKLIGPAASVVFFIMAIVIVDVEWYQYKNGGNKVKLYLCKFKTDRGTNVNDFLDNGGGLCTWTHFCTIMNCILLALITLFWILQLFSKVHSWLPWLTPGKLYGFMWGWTIAHYVLLIMSWLIFAAAWKSNQKKIRGSNACDNTKQCNFIFNDKDNDVKGGPGAGWTISIVVTVFYGVMIWWTWKTWLARPRGADAQRETRGGKSSTHKSQV